jgi:hypothetical protein
MSGQLSTLAALPLGIESIGCYEKEKYYAARNEILAVQPIVHCYPDSSCNTYRVSGIYYFPFFSSFFTCHTSAFFFGLL